MGMKCEVCEQEGLSWWRKLPLIMTLPMKCPHCGARYRLGRPSNLIPEPIKKTWDFLFGWFDVIIIFLVLAFLTYVVNTTSWAFAFACGIIIWIVLVMITPHQLNHRDPVNAIVQRIQEKKRKMASTDANPDP